MKKAIRLVGILCCLLVLAGCSRTYQRIDLRTEDLGDDVERYIDSNTQIVNTAGGEFMEQIPVYKISKRNISNLEYLWMLNSMGLDQDSVKGYVNIEENCLRVNIKEMFDIMGEFKLTDEQVEKLAWEAFNKVPFLSGTYVYEGIQETESIYDSQGYYIYRKGVSFRRVIDGIPVKGNDRLEFSFDNSGLVAMYIELYDYTKIDTLDMVPFESAIDKLIFPDYFSLGDGAEETKLSTIATFYSENVQLIYGNQYQDGCTILQPIYRFTGTAMDVDGKEDSFVSLVIAIPEEYTYDKVGLEQG